ncbi:stage III sporulation protein AF [Paenibacillus paridis]|uniref:stage III sporulation protein AF n=1 Tax=Paenibacillus paridis TaxID=2583376 RepID=UPI001121AC7F|nr:stage III sporulation protein AF [Paenibacillus paridis]
MVAWLSDWLRDIIAIILLAVFVELLLPNKAMQRYARLVVGLFILLTILSPILKLIQSDIGAKLEEGMKQWSKTAMTSDVQMTSLNQIAKNAEALSDKRALEAAKLTERTLEAAIREELIQSTKATVNEVDAVLKWVTVSGRQTPYISQITVTLASVQDKPDASGKESAVESVQPVIVQIEIEPSANEASAPGQGSASPDFEAESSEERQGGKWTEADPATAGAIRKAITRSWSVEAEQIRVRQPAQQPVNK